MSKVEKPDAEPADGTSEASDRAMVEVSDLTKTFGDLVAADDVNLDVRDGEFFSIIGPSGSGKTTLLRMLAGFAEPTRGMVRIDGRECTYDKPYHRNTNMIFQDLALFPHLDVKENISYGLVESGIDQDTIDEKVAEALHTVDLEGYQDRDISELSGGEKQRVALARGLVNEPSVLLLDEPLASLDEKLKEAMKVELKRIQERSGTTFVYVTHDQEVAMAMSDRIAILREGVIQQIASPQEMYTHPANTFVADFTGAENIFEAEIIAQDRSSGTVRIGGFALDAEISEGVRAGDGDDCRLVIRPESISVHPTEGRVSGTVTDLGYKGALVEVFVNVATESETLPITAEVHYEDVEALSEGQEVYLDWNDANARVVQER